MVVLLELGEYEANDSKKKLKSRGNAYTFN
jgi:hypothetical protein